MSELWLPRIIKTKEMMRIPDYRSKREHVPTKDRLREIGGSKAFISRYLHLIVRAGLLAVEDPACCWQMMAESAPIRHPMSIGLPDESGGQMPPAPSPASVKKNIVNVPLQTFASLVGQRRKRKCSRRFIASSLRRPDRSIHHNSNGLHTAKFRWSIHA